MINNRETLIELLYQLETTLEVSKSAIHYNQNDSTLKSIKSNIENRLGELRCYLATRN